MEIYGPGRARDGESIRGVEARGRGHRHHGHSSRSRRPISGHDRRLRQGPSLNEGPVAEPTIPASAWVGSALGNNSFNQGPALRKVMYLEPRSRISSHDHGLRQVSLSGKFAEPTISASPSVGLVGSACESSVGSCSEGEWKTNYTSCGSRNSGSVSSLSENESSKWMDVIEISADDETREEVNSMTWAVYDNVLMDDLMNRSDDEIKKLLTNVEDMVGNLYITNKKMESLVGQLAGVIAVIFIVLVAYGSKDSQTS